MKSTLAVFFAAFVVLVAMRWHGSAFSSELGGHPDEAAHYVTGLMMRDYIAARCPGSPMKFAENYYAHYPKIGLGVWPPFFYLVQSAWTLIFPATSASVLVLICAIASASAALLYREVAVRHGAVAGGFAALVFVLLPIVQEYSGLVMAEMPCTLLMLGATVAFGRFLESGSRRGALAFGSLAALAILTKGTGLALALVPPFAVLFSRRWKVLRSPSLWLAALIVVVLAGPWTWKTRDIGHGGWVYSHPTWLFTREAVPYYLSKFRLSLGSVLLVFFLAGTVAGLRNRQPAGCRLHAHFALVLGVLLFQSVMPVGYEARHLISMLPSAILLVCEGAVLVAGLLSARGVSAALAKAVAFGVPLLVFAVTTFQLVEKHDSGFRELARRVVGGSLAHDRPVLVSSDARGEGMLISEVAQIERRPGSTIQRASKVLSKSEWSGRGYQSFFSDEKEMFDFLKGARFSVIVLDDSVPVSKRQQHHDLLLRTLRAHPESFESLLESPVCRDGRWNSGVATAWLVHVGN